jgi:hypothetical protein
MVFTIFAYLFVKNIQNKVSVCFYDKQLQMVSSFQEPSLGNLSSFPIATSNQFRKSPVTVILKENRPMRENRTEI